MKINFCIIIILCFLSNTGEVFPASPCLTSISGRQLIKSFEGCRLRAYKCPANVWTIGYGNTKHAKEGLTITKVEAEKFLMEDLQRFEKYVNSSINRLLVWHQFDALVSFSFNCGYQVRGELKDAVNRNQTGLVLFKLRQYIHAKGKELHGLIRRRNAECKFYKEGILN